MKLNELIYLQNPWWRDPGFLPREYFLAQRKIFPRFYQEIVDFKQIISLTGLRRVGKSTLIKQVIAKMLRNKAKSNQILYFSFDQPTVIEQPKTLEEIIDWFFKRILSRSIHRLNQRVYIFLDEIQLIPFWQDIVKRYYDLNQNIKFVVSGSSTLFISKGSQESLAGRIFERDLPPLSFSEYKKLSARADFVDYLDFGQFPELLEIKDISKKIDYLKEGVIGKILEVDIVKSYRIRKTVDFERLFWSLLPNTGQIISSKKLMFDLSFKKATLFKYLAILEKSLLLNKVLNLSGSFRSEKRLLRKLYPASTNFLSLLPEPLSIGFKAESYAASLLKLKEKQVFLFHRRGKEIDFVLPKKRIAFEVKYQEKIHPDDYKFLASYIKEKKYLGIILTKEEEKKLPQKNLIFLPLEKLEKTVV